MNPLRLVSDKEAFKNYSESKINYSAERISGEEFFIQPHPLIFETGIREQSITCFDFKGRPAFFKTDGDFPFDIFSAAFYLVSRYEEYLPFSPINMAAFRIRPPWLLRKISLTSH